MRVFISWSGAKSLHLARALHGWLPNVIQDVDPFLSEEEIKKGARWPQELSSRLQDCNVGIVCATPEAIKSPWVLYEAGAITKLLDGSALISILFGVTPSDLMHHPLSGFQTARLEKDEIFKVVDALNIKLGDDGLEADRLKLIFTKWWSDFEASVESWTEEDASMPLLEADGPTVTIDALSVQLSDLIQQYQEVSRLLASPEKLLPASYVRSILASRGLLTRDGLATLNNLRDRLIDLRSFVEHEMQIQNKHQKMLVAQVFREIFWDSDDLIETGGTRRKGKWRDHKSIRTLLKPTRRMAVRERADIVKIPSAVDEHDNS